MSAARSIRPIRMFGTCAGTGIKSSHVWDLQAFEGQIYLGGGSTTQNAGPLNVWAYHPVKEGFDLEYTVPEEAIELFRVFDGKLYIPAADPIRGDTHKYYRKADGVWEQVRGGPDLAHVRDLYWHNGKLVGVGNPRQPKKTSGAIVSLDGGSTLQGATDFAQLAWLDNWFYALFEYEGILFAPSLRFSPTRDASSILTFNNATNRFEVNSTFRTADFLPITGEPLYQNATIRLWQPVEFQGTLVYAAKSYCAHKDCYESLYFRSYSMFVKSSLVEPPFAVTFPDKAAIGEELLVRDGILYALANRRTEEGLVIIYVYRTTSPASDWKEVLHFTCPNKARSFELLDNSFYFGLGHDPDEAVGGSGALWRVPAKPQALFRNLRGTRQKQHFCRFVVSSFSTRIPEDPPQATSER